MSARQVSRINQELYLKELEKSNNEAGVSSDDEAPKPRKSNALFMLNESSESEHDGESEDDNEISVNRSCISKSAPSVDAKSVKPVEENDEIAFLESIAAENEGTESGALAPPPVRSYFSVDAKNLDVDKILNDKFSRNNFMKQHETEGGRRKQTGGSKGVMRKNLIASHRNYLFGSPKDDWTKPPSFVGGGIQLVRSADADHPWVSHFDVQWSPDFSRTNELYQLVQNTGDVNRLVMFLANHPYHVEGLLQLAMVFARFGLIERSSDLVRRCLYVFECSSPESFKPFNGTCRLDPSLPQNSLYYQALFKHVQACHTLGCHTLASDLCRVMLSLCPADLSGHRVLLTLDYYLIHAAQYELLQSFAREPHEGVVELSDPTTYQLPSPYRLSSAPADHASAPPAHSIGEPAPAVSSIADLPNWWFSVALSHYLAELDAQRSQTYNTSSSSSSSPSSSSSGGSGFRVVSGGASITTRHAVSCFLLKCAIFRYPFMLEPLLGKAGVTVGMFAGAAWKTIFNSELLYSSMGRVPYQSYLRSVSSIYSQRMGPLWNTPEIHSWAMQAASELMAHLAERGTMAGVVQEQTAHYSELSTRKALSHYSSASLEDFVEEVPRMPNDINQLIDPQLLDPRVLAGQVRFDAQQLGVQLPRNRPRLNRHEREVLEQQRRAELSDVLDLSMPLMELLLASLMPWYRIPRPKR